MTTSFFLGANSGAGFYSLYDGFAKAAGDFSYLIKAGPGGGKSSFMRRLGKEAEKRGMDVEYILCSGDPDSLDGIYIPALRCAVIDATAPHPSEPDCFGAQSCYVNLGVFCSPPRADESITNLTEEYKGHYARAYRLLAAAAQVKRRLIAAPDAPGVADTVRRRAASALSRELGCAKRGGGDGTVCERFLHCISCRGELCLDGTISELCKRTYLLDNRFGLGFAYLDVIMREALQRGEKIIRCPDPLCPDLTEAVLMPERALGFVCSSLCKPKEPWRHVRLDALLPAAGSRQQRGCIRRCEKLHTALLDEAVHELRQAKKHHDELEAAYRPYVDFEGLDRFTGDFIGKLF